MTTQFKSIRDFGYQLAQHEDVGMDFARWAVANIPDLMDLGEENKRLLQTGFLLRKQEITPVAYYLRTDTDKYQPTDKAGKDVTTIDIDYVFSYSQQQYGSFRTKQPGLFAIMQPVRIDGQKYVSGKIRALMRKVSELNPKQRERSETASFIQWLAEFAESVPKKAKVCRGRGDDTAPTDAEATAIRAALLKFTK
jgi:hypothetical protein